MFDPLWKPLKLWGRILVRTFRASRHVRSVKNFALAAGVFLGLYRPDWFQQWLDSDSDNKAIAALGCSLLLLLLSSYETERELDAKNIVKVTVRNMRAVFRPLYSVGKGEKPNVLMLEAELSFRNESNTPTRLYFPKIEILRPIRLRRWKPVEMERLLFTGSNFPRNIPRERQWTLWSSEQRHELKALDETVGNIHVFWSLPDTTLAYLDNNLKVSFTVDIIGQGEAVIEKSLSSIVREEARK
jgi:hypothetical protein